MQELWIVFTLIDVEAEIMENCQSYPLHLNFKQFV